MCTVTWLPVAGEPGSGYELFFNRDELRSRAPALPPAPARTNGVRYLAPTDTDAGGSWISINELGAAVGLLNAHPPDPADPSRPVSRGHLVRELADLESARDLRGRLSSLGLGRLRPFTLFAVSADESVAVFDWDGRSLAERHPGSPFVLSSSSVDSAGAEIARRDLLRRFLEQGPAPSEAHLEFHRSHLPTRGALAPCMHRADARTVSFLQARVTGSSVHTAYAPGPPCRTSVSERCELRRAGSAVPDLSAAE